MTNLDNGYLQKRISYDAQVSALSLYKFFIICLLPQSWLENIYSLYWGSGKKKKKVCIEVSWCVMGD